MQRGLLPISQYALRFYGQVAYHDYEGATLVPGERKRFQECVGDPNVSILVLRNHGIVTLGASVADAFLKMYFLDRACAVQIALCNSGELLIEPPAGICALTARQFLGSEEENMDKKLALEWSALKRLVADETMD
jgi:ribulose-5-phosphate 4-epimerase/fuculose-1-phosphate aldolase